MIGILPVDGHPDGYMRTGLDQTMYIFPYHRKGSTSVVQRTASVMHSLRSVDGDYISHYIAAVHQFMHCRMRKCITVCGHVGNILHSVFLAEGDEEIRQFPYRRHVHERLSSKPGHTQYFEKAPSSFDITLYRFDSGLIKRACLPVTFKAIYTSELALHGNGNRQIEGRLIILSCLIAFGPQSSLIDITTHHDSGCLQDWRDL